MKKILCLVLAVAMLFCFAACGGSESTESTASGATNATSIKFSADSYKVKVDDYNMISDGIVVEPAGAKVLYEVSDTEIATISKKGEISGLKEGTVTVTAKSEDGKVTATCTVVVYGVGQVSDRLTPEDLYGIVNKRAESSERVPDSKAIIVIISKNVDKNADKTIVTTLDYGSLKDGYYVNSGDGFYVARNNVQSSYLIEDVIPGDYVGLIISGEDYTGYKTYDNSTILPTLKNSALSSVLSDAELTALAATDAMQDHEFVVKEFTVKSGETTVFGNEFDINK